MFSSEIDSRLNPLVSRARGIVLGSVLLVAVVASLISARSIPFFLGVLAGSFILAGLIDKRAEAVKPAWGVIGWTLVAFLGYATLSSLWAVEPHTTLSKVSLAALIVIGTAIVMRLLFEETRPNLLQMAEGLWVGLLVTLTYSLIEILSDQAIKIWLYNALGVGREWLTPERNFKWIGERLVKIASVDMTRNATPTTLLLWPALMAIVGGISRPWNFAWSAALMLLAAAVIFASTHETSKLAMATGIITFFLARYSQPWTSRLLRVTWVLTCLAILPAAMAAHRLDLHNASWLQTTARHRIIIWNHTAEQTLLSPIFGNGAEMTYIIGPQLKKSAKKRPDEQWVRTLSLHAHNVYLQTWFELGLIGALLLTAVGLAILRTIDGLSPVVQPYIYATFASGASIAASSYGMWQIWFMAMYGLAFLACAIGIRCLGDLGRDPLRRG